MIRPEIIIRAYSPRDLVLKEIVSGIEEEGVLYKIIDEAEAQSEEVLGHMASEMSQLQVGIGINSDRAALYIQKIKNAPLLATTQHHRKLGQNAARYVKGNPLIEI